MARLDRRLTVIALAALLAINWAPVRANSFEVGISPSRFEFSAKSGGRLAQSLTVFDLASAATDVAVRTLDWTFAEDGNISHHDDVLPGSCRPWVTLERRSVRVASQGGTSFRFQIDAGGCAPRECLFMPTVEG